MKQTTKWLDAALIALGLKQAAWADDVSDFRETLQAAERGNAQAQNNLGLMYEPDAACAKTMPKRSDGIGRRRSRGMPKPKIIWVKRMKKG